MASDIPTRVGESQFSMSTEVATHELSPALTIWHRYDPTAKVDLFATKITTTLGACLIDPIPIPPAILSDLIASDRVIAIILTNGNHLRAAEDFSRQFDVPIYAHAGAVADLTCKAAVETADGDRIALSLETITLDGAAPGEIALHSGAEGGTLILGDALINMGSLGFTFLPAKYCTNPKLMRKSLRKLLRYPCERILFAHGTPIVSQARSRLAELLNGPEPRSRK